MHTAVCKDVIYILIFDILAYIFHVGVTYVNCTRFIMAAKEGKEGNKKYILVHKSLITQR